MYYLNITRTLHSHNKFRAKGEKKMLNKKLPPDGTDLSIQTAVNQGITHIDGQAAANAANYQLEQMKARRLRRQSRLARQASGKPGGWTVGLW